MSFLEAVIVALSTAYFSIILANDKIVGPFSILHSIRIKAGVRWENGWTVTRPGSLADMIMCPYCNSLWVGLVVCAAFAGARAIGLPASWLFLPAASAGAVVTIQELKGGRD